MSLLKVFDIAGSAMAAQSVRMNTTASNLANAGAVAGTPEAAYRARQPLFETVLADPFGDAASVGVRVAGVTESAAEPQRVHQPGHPEADEEGYVYLSNVNPVDELVNMITASRSYQNSIEVLETSKELVLRTLNIGR